MSNLRTFLFIFLLIAINPNGSTLAEFYTSPKQLILVFITITNLFQVRSWQLPPQIRKIVLCWLAFLICGLISTINAPYFPDSIFGQSEMGDGLLWWMVCSSFAITQLAARTHQTDDLLGVRIGGLIVSVSAAIAWLFSSISPWVFRLYSHPAHAAVVVAMIASIESGWFFLAESLSLFLLGNRASIIALFSSKLWQLRVKFPQWYVALPLAILIIIMGFDRKIPNQPVLNEFSSGRLGQYQLAINRIGWRPFLGWGFPGYRQSYPYYEPNSTPIHLGRGIYYAPKVPRYGAIPTSKAHNLILDSLLSVGIIGSFFYFYLIYLYWSLNPQYKTPIIVYFVWSMLWYDCAQFTTLFWFFLSLWTHPKLSSSSP